MREKEKEREREREREKERGRGRERKRKLPVSETHALADSPPMVSHRDSAISQTRRLDPGLWLEVQH